MNLFKGKRKSLRIFLNEIKLKALNKKFQEKRCFIIGNGPSLKLQNLDLLQDEYCFVNNWFTLNPSYKKMKSVFHFFGDPHFTTSNGFVDGFTDKIIKNQNAKVFTDEQYYPLIHSDENLNFKNTNLLSIDLEAKVWKGNFHADPLLPLCWGRSVVIDFCIPMAIHMGFTEIYLLGCDCDYSGGTFKDSYFYDLKDLPLEDQKNLEALQKRDPPSSFEETFEASYTTVKKFCDERGVKIFNATKGGKLEVFPRKNLEDLF